jgi:hypothetical protein
MIGRLIPFVLILIAAGLFFGYVNPTYTGEIASLKTEIAGYDSALSAANDFTKKEDQLEAERGAISPEDQDRVETFLPDGVDNVQLILDLNSLASRSGLVLSNFDAKEAVGSQASANGSIPLASESNVDSLDLTVSGIGSYQAFKTFLTGAERSLRPLDLTSLSLEATPTGAYDYDMTFRIYWLR